MHALVINAGSISRQNRQPINMVEAAHQSLRVITLTLTDAVVSHQRSIHSLAPPHRAIPGSNRL